MSEKNYGNDSQIAEIVKYISDTMKFPIMGAGGGFAPIGTINSYMGTTAPIGWLACDGTVYNISDYPDLATHIASHFGSTNFFGGDGTTTFGVPDLRGEFLRGTGTNSHTNTELGATEGNGANVGAHQNATVIPNAWCDGSNFGLGGKNETGGSVGSRVQNKDSKKYTYWSRYLDNTSTWTQDPDGYGSIYTSRPTNTSVLFIIKATISDTELENMHVYSPNEHQVGWWEEEIDGVWKRKPVYERTVQFYKNNAPASGWNNSGGHWYYTDFTANFFELLLDAQILIQDASGNLASDLTLAKSSTFDITWYAAGYFTLNFSTNYNNWFVFTYTKTTDDWQTV